MLDEFEDGPKYQEHELSKRVTTNLWDGRSFFFFRIYKLFITTTLKILGSS